MVTKKRRQCGTGRDETGKHVAACEKDKMILVCEGFPGSRRVMVSFPGPSASLSVSSLFQCVCVLL